MHTPLVQVTNLCKNFNDFKAVDHLSFEVLKGDVYGFLGQNGAGKSTTIRMLLTLIAPTSGEIQLFGHRLPRHRSEILRKVGAVVERPDLYKFLTAYDNLRIFARLSGLKPHKKMLLESLEKVQLADRAFDKVKAYSQGMKQRLGIAIALIHDPELIILDEPTNGLDPQGIAEMRQLIIRLRRDMGKTVIVSSHLLNEVEQIATRMIIIHKGKKIIEGRTADLFDPAKTEILLDTDSKNMDELMQGSAFEKNMQPGEDGWKFRLHANEVPLLAKDLVDRGIPINNLSKTHSLENLFISLTSEVHHQ